jgi:hypothetical protein
MARQSCYGSQPTERALGALPVPANECKAVIEPVAQWGWYAELLETSREGKRQDQESAQEVTTSGAADLHPGRAFDLRGDGRD